MWVEKWTREARVSGALATLVACFAALCAVGCGSDTGSREADPDTLDDVSPADDLHDDLRDGDQDPAEDADVAGDVEDEPLEPPPRVEGLCWAPPPPRTARGVRLERVFDHLFETTEDTLRLVQMVPSPFEPGEWYLVHHRGWVTRFAEDPAGRSPETVLDIRDGRLMVANDEAGIVSMAFHPSARYAVLAYQATSRHGTIFDSVVSRFDVRADGTIDADSEVELLRLPQPRFPHAVDHVVFGPDGMLYAAFGDGGGRDNRIEAQNPFNFYGTIVRIDVDGDDPERGLPYRIPPDNPFADGQEGAPEVYAYGLRNMWRFSFDRETGVLWGGDVGEVRQEEINRILPGRNYGWPIMEGDLCFEAETCDDSPFEPPVVTYGRNEGRSVTGGFVYRGGNVPALFGRYVFADYMDGRIWSIDAETAAGEAEMRLEVEEGFFMVSLAESRNGELYVLRWSQTRFLEERGAGGIYRLAPVVEDADDERDVFPRRLSETGCVDPEDPREPAPGLRPYRPAAELWSDAAEKDRYLSLPAGEEVTIAADGRFVFPVGTVLVKTFRYGERLHETRLYVNHERYGWRGYSYRWLEDQSDAVLLREGVNEYLPNQVFWRHPSPLQCTTCHTAAAGETLGLEVGQFLGPDGGGPASLLHAWWEEEVLAEDPAALAERHEALRGITEGDATLERRARSYLHINCASCHRPGGNTRSALDFRYTTALADMGACDVEPLSSIPGLPDPESQRLLVPGSPVRSVLFQRMVHPGEYRMPPLGTYTVDVAASDVVARWIRSLEDCGTGSDR